MARPSMADAAAASFAVRASAGSLRAADGLELPHAWTDEGVVAETGGTGAHLLHLSVALCVLNDTFREAQRLDVPVRGVAVSAEGTFDDEWRSAGITYVVTVDSPGDAAEVASLLEVVDDVAEIPRAIRAGTIVERTP